MHDCHIEQRKHLGLITLARPGALNALTLPMIQAIGRQLMAWKTDDSIHAVVIRGEGEKAFCAGGDVRWLYETGRVDYAAVMEFFWHEYRLNHAIYTYPKPYIALMQGLTMGGGVGISLHGSYPVASETFTFAMPETGIGFFPDIGASYLLTRLPGAVGRYLGLTGESLHAADALAMGLVKQIIPQGCFSDFIQALTDAELSRQPLACIQACAAEFALDCREGVLNQPVLETLQACFSEESIETIIARLQIQTSTAWGARVAALLLKKSPLALKVTLAQLQRAQTMPMAGCLAMDYRLVSHFMQGHDFYEGVRALLIDKDKSPRWQPRSLSAVSLSQVELYFNQVVEKALDVG